MTTRERFERRATWISVVFVPCFLLFLPGLFLGTGALQQGNPAGLIGFVPFALGFIVGLITLTAFQCPRCHQGLWRLFLQMGGFKLSQNPPVCFCPYCGARLDEKRADRTAPPELPAREEITEGPSRLPPRSSEGYRSSAGRRE